MVTTTETVEDVEIVDVSLSHLDASNIDTFKADMEPLLSRSHRLLLDLGHLEFIDSSGLGALLFCLRHQKQRGGSLKLFGMTPQVRMLFELVRMHQVFDIFNSRDEALKSFTLPNNMTVVLPSEQSP